MGERHCGTRGSGGDERTAARSLRFEPPARPRARARPAVAAGRKINENGRLLTQRKRRTWTTRDLSERPLGQSRALLAARVLRERQGEAPSQSGGGGGRGAAARSRLCLMRALSHHQPNPRPLSPTPPEQSRVSLAHTRRSPQASSSTRGQTPNSHVRRPQNNKTQGAFSRGERLCGGSSLLPRAPTTPSAPPISAGSARQPVRLVVCWRMGVAPPIPGACVCGRRLGGEEREREAVERESARERCRGQLQTLLPAAFGAPVKLPRPSARTPCPRVLHVTVRRPCGRLVVVAIGPAGASRGGSIRAEEEEASCCCALFFSLHLHLAHALHPPSLHPNPHNTEERDGYRRQGRRHDCRPHGRG